MTVFGAEQARESKALKSGRESTQQSSAWRRAQRCAAPTRSIGRHELRSRMREHTCIPRVWPALRHSATAGRSLSKTGM